MNMVQEVTMIQELVLQLIEAHSFNNFNGRQISSGLRHNPELWKGVLFWAENSFELLQSLQDDRFFGDTILIMTSGKEDWYLEYMAETWKPSTIQWKSNPNPSESSVLYLSWD